MKRCTQILSGLLCIALCLSLLPAAAVAEDNSENFIAGVEEPEAIQNDSMAEASEDSDATEDMTAVITVLPSEEAEQTGLTEVQAADEIIISDDETGEDNNDLFAGYVDQVFHGNNGIMLMSTETSGELLTGNNRIMYDTLKPQIEAIAAGTASDTRLGVPLSSILTKFEFKAEELGVTEITADNIETVYNRALNYDARTVINALMADCPYELYWYAKTKGVTISVNYAYNSTEVIFSDSGSVWFSFCVAAEYAADPTADPAWATDISKTGAASLAAAKAQEVVAAAADYSDYDKLAYYRMQICDMTSYNSDAAAGSVPYGDPWQLIYVFDNDPETKVVCEGYAKAFQYLCELTEFDSYGVRCITVTGTLSGNNHMWNVVRMPGGGNYLVDVTNCDSGAVGAPDLLFMRGYSSGSVEEGYCIQLTGSQSVTYIYDTETWDSRYRNYYLALNDLDCNDSGEAEHDWADWSLDATTGNHIRSCRVCERTETCISGDVYWDDEVNLKDLLTLKQWLSGYDVDIYMEGADVYWDGNVNLKDLLTLKNMLANS